MVLSGSATICKLCFIAMAAATTGIRELDDALGGLYWGDNVVWEV